MITPQSEIYILKCPLQLSNKHQLTFTNSNAQFNYFYSLPKLGLNDGSYMRKDGVLRFPGHIDSIQEYNYCMYKNSNYTNKWFYAFISRMEYVNDNMTNIYLKTDVFQTWFYMLDFKQSFIEREMVSVSDDVPGANLLPEGLEFGEVKVAGTAGFDELEPAFIVAYTGDTYGQQHISDFGFKYNGIPSSVAFIATTNALHTVLQIINRINQAGDKILTVFSIPKLAIQSRIPIDPPGETTYYDEVLPSTFKQDPITKTLISRPTTIDGYTPRNKKLLQFPYLYLGFNPQNGSQKIYKYENFANGTPVFKLISEISPNPTVQFIPQNYRGSDGDSLSDNCTMNGYPTISYKNDVYNTWLAQNSEIVSLQMQHEQYNYEISAIQSGMNLASQIAGSGMGGKNGDYGQALESLMSVASSALNLTSLDKNHDFYTKQQMAQIEKQKLLPDNASLSSTNSTLLGYDLFNQNIFTRYNIKAQFAERLDKYFDLYGYLTNKIKVPNLYSRPNWNYIKTIGINIYATIPQIDLQEIKEMFDNGVTLWHNPNTFLDYSQNNR